METTQSDVSMYLYISGPPFLSVSFPNVDNYLGVTKILLSDPERVKLSALSAIRSLPEQDVIF